MKIKFTAAALGLAFLASGGALLAQRGVVLTSDNRLATFDAATPGTTGAPVSIMGLQGGESLIGLDYRPIDRTLVGVTNQNRIVTINATTGATKLLSTLSTPLAGTAFGVDFNPVPDRLRANSNTGVNYRINVDTGAVTADGQLVYDVADAGAGSATLVSGAAYTNSVGGKMATATALYNIDYGRDTLVKQDPPNNGVLKTIGALGVDATEMTGFDVFSPTKGYASISSGSSASLYSVNLMSGAATLVGAFPSAMNVIDLALMVKEPSVGITNTSARGSVGTGEAILITGFIVKGDAPINVAVIARGPSLSQYGITAPVADPIVSIWKGSTQIDTNDNWKTGPNADALTTAGLSPANDLDSALWATLEPGVYTAHVAGAANGTGIATVEVFEID